LSALASGFRQLADLELRHPRRARCEDRIRGAKDTGLRNPPLKGFAQNRVWCELVTLACDLIAWMQMLALTGNARRQGSKRLRLRLFTVPAAWPAAAGGCACGSQNAAPGQRRYRRRHPLAGHPGRLISRNSPSARKGKPQPVEPHPPRATAGQPGAAARRKSTPAEHLEPPQLGHERSRLATGLPEFALLTVPSPVRDTHRAWPDHNTD
jgi:hypothetical protein